MEVKLKQVDENTLDALPVAVVLFDSRQIYFLNKKAAELLKIPKKLTTEKLSIFQFTDKKYHAALKRDIAKVLKGDAASLDELELKNFRDHTISVEWSSNGALFNKKAVAQAVFTEISDYKKKVIEYEQSEELLHNISNNSLDVIFHVSFSPKPELKFISDSSKQVLGFSPEQIYKDPAMIKSRVHVDDQHLVSIKKSDYLKGSKEKKLLVRFRHKNGKTRQLEVSINNVYNDKEDISGLVGDIRDVTDRIETESLLIETKEKFDLITNNGNDIVAFYSYFPVEGYLYVSPNIKKILGYDAGSLLSDHNFLTRHLSGPNDEFEQAEKLLKGYQKKNIIKNHHFAFKVLNKKREQVWLENNLVPITDPQGHISFFLNIIRDITEQKDRELEIQNQYINYRNLLDNSPVAYVIHESGNVLYVNNALTNLFKIKDQSQLVGKFGIDFFVGSDRKKAVDRVKQIYGGRSKSDFNNYTLTDLEGNLLDVEIKSVRIKFNDKDCILSLVNNLTDKRQREEERERTLHAETSNLQLQREIKDRKEAEKNLIEKTAQLLSIFESSTHLIWTVNRQLQVTSFNQNFHDVVMLQHNISIKPGYKIDEHLLKGRNEYIHFWYTKYAEAFTGKKLEFEKEDYNDKKVFRKIFINPILNEAGQVTDISCIAHDITDSKIYEQKLLNQTGKLSAIFDSSSHYIWTINRENKLTSFNKNYFDLITIIYGTKPYLGFMLNRGVLTNDKEYTELLEYHYNKAFNGNATSFEIETLDKNYKKIYLEIFLNPIFENDNVVEVSGIAHNITEKKQVQQRMELSLKEKEVLLREVHHRVKNNMQVISSILNLQSSYVSDEYALTLLKESQNRIKTMAYIHESLYQNKSFTSVNFSDYVYTLVNNIVQSYSYSSEKINLELNVEKFNLSLDSSIPAGLIINELVTNAIKHAFPGERQGTIFLNLKCENNCVFLELKDNGVGFAEGIDFENSNSLGLQLVNTLIEQLEGDFEFNSQKDKGTQVLITFKM